MGVRKAAAQGISAVSTAALKHVFHRPAANFPGKIALYADPRIIADMAHKLHDGSICVVGTNGKTTVTSLIADSLEASGKTVVCNRTGANLDSGVATSLLHADPSDWGVFECDELWLGKVTPQLQPTYVLLLNLFRDQLDRCGEIDRIQESIVAALAASPHTVLLYNGDDPLCEIIARKASNKAFAFGIGEDLGLPQNTVSDARMCQQGPHMLEYTYRQYGQLGDFFCPECDFKRAPLVYSAHDVHVGEDGLSFDVERSCAIGAADGAKTAVPDDRVSASYTGVYMIYNLLAVLMAAECLGANAAATQRAIDAYDPGNGRLQWMDVAGRSVLLNLAKNPTGFNQNLKLVCEAPGRKAAAFFINDKEADGHDISWIWDIDFEELADRAGDGLTVYAGGLRANDVQLRLKYAGVKAELVASAAEAMDKMSALPVDCSAYFIANYTALPAVKADLTRLAEEGSTASAASSARSADDASTAAEAAKRGDRLRHADSAASQASAVELPAVPAALQDKSPLRIVHLFPDLLNLYGDGGNVKVLRQRCAWRGIPVEAIEVLHGQTTDLSRADIVFMGGGPDREQKLASEQLLRMRDDLRAFVEDDGALLAICGGYQILGSKWLLADSQMEGLGLVGIETRRGPDKRLIDNIVLDSPLADLPVVGYENHAGRTFILDDGLKPFGTVKDGVGCGNNDESGADGIVYRSVVGTYLHGPLLGKNPQVADWLIERALARKTGMPDFELQPLDDAVEVAANKAVCGTLGIK